MSIQNEIMVEARLAVECLLEAQKYTANAAGLQDRAVAEFGTERDVVKFFLELDNLNTLLWEMLQVHRPNIAEFELARDRAAEKAMTERIIKEIKEHPAMVVES